ncbi:hypothetical protein Tco_1475778 [Tanacetum coccineum]
MAIPKQLILNVHQSSYYLKYLEMVAKNTKKTPQDSASKQPEPATRRAPPKKPTNTTPVKPTKPPSSKQPKSPTKKPSKVKGKKGEGTDLTIERAIKLSLDPSFLPQDSGKVHVSLAGPNPEHTDEEFLATAYLNVHENLKLITDEYVIEDNPKSHSGSMSSMKNLEDTDNFGDQFLNDKPTEDDQEKSKVVTTPPITTEATSITTTLLEITSFIALQLRVAKLEQDMSEVKKTDHCTAAYASINPKFPTVYDMPWIRRLKTGLKTPTKESMIVMMDEDNYNDKGPSAGSNQEIHKREDTFSSEPESGHSEPSSIDVQNKIKGNFSNGGHLIMLIFQRTTGENSYARTYQISRREQAQKKTYEIAPHVNVSADEHERKKLCKADWKVPQLSPPVKAFHKNHEFVALGGHQSEHPSETKIFTMKMEILLEPTSNKLLVGDLCDSTRIKLVSTESNDGRCPERQNLRSSPLPSTAHNERSPSLMESSPFETVPIQVADKSLPLFKNTLEVYRRRETSAGATEAEEAFTAAQGSI